MTTYLEDLNRALRELLSEDERVYLWGEDLLDPYGGAFKVTRGLQADFPERVWTTPISEAAIVGLGSGMALRGYRPIVEIMFGDFIALAADQIINYAAKFRSMYNDRAASPLIVRTPMGGGRGYGPTHSQSLEKILFGTPGLLILSPSRYHQPGQLIRQAVAIENRPVLFLEHKSLYGARLQTDLGETGSGHYPTRTLRNFSEGRPDVTLITYGGSSLLLEALLNSMREEEIRILACVPAQIHPLPRVELTAAAAESGRVLVLEEGTLSFGWGAEVSARLQVELWNRLAAPIRRLAAADSIIPASRPLEQAVLPGLEALEAAIYELML